MTIANETPLSTCFLCSAEKILVFIPSENLHRFASVCWSSGFRVESTSERRTPSPYKMEYDFLPDLLIMMCFLKPVSIDCRCVVETL